MKVKVLLFARLKEILGKEMLVLELPERARVAVVLSSLIQNQDLCEKVRSSIMFAVNQKYVRPEQVLRDGDELALIPPVAGG